MSGTAATPIAPLQQQHANVASATAATAGAIPANQQHLRSTTSSSSLVGKTKFEWIIRDFQTILDSLDERCLGSNVFDVVADASNAAKFRLWCQKAKDSEDFGFFLQLMDKKMEVTVDFSLAFLKADGVTQWGGAGPFRNQKYVNNNVTSKGRTKLVTLQKLREELLLLPDGNLTVVCDLTVRFGDDGVVLHTPVERVDPVAFPHLHSSLSGSVSSLLSADPSHLSDVTLVCGEMSFPCHKLTLASRSDVFKTMFNDEGRFVENGGVVVDDIEESVMAKLIHAFYADSFSESCLGNDQACLELLKAAEKYNFVSRKTFCENKMTKGVTVENAASVLSWALACNAGNLAKVAEQFVKQRAVEIVKTASFAELMRAFPDALNEESDKAASAPKKARLA